MNVSTVGEEYWTPERLSQLRVRDGFRLRGEENSRLEMFSDAAFAFAMTMQVVAAESMPRTYPELVEALKGIPAFAASFALIMMLWGGHRRWSRRYGLEDGVSVMLSLSLIFVVLVYIYPLRLMASVLLSFLSAGVLPSELEISGAQDLVGLFVAYGVGYFVLAGLLALHFRRALMLGESLALSRIEKEFTRFEVRVWGTNSLAGLASALVAALTPSPVDRFAGFVYLVLPVAMPILSVRFGRRLDRLLERSLTADDELARLTSAQQTDGPSPDDDSLEDESEVAT